MKAAAALLCSSLAVLAAGCGGSSSKSSSSGAFSVQSSSDRAKETLRIYGFGKGDDVAQNRAALAKQAIAPAKLINPEGAYDPQKSLTQLASGSVPDLVYLDRQQVATLAAKGALTPLQDCVKAQGIDLSQYRRPALDEASYQGKLYALMNPSTTVRERLDGIHALAFEPRATRRSRDVRGSAPPPVRPCTPCRRR